MSANDQLDAYEALLPRIERFRLFAEGAKIRWTIILVKLEEFRFASDWRRVRRVIRVGIEMPECLMNKLKSHEYNQIFENQPNSATVSCLVPHKNIHIYNSKHLNMNVPDEHWARIQVDIQATLSFLLFLVFCVAVAWPNRRRSTTWKAKARP